MIRYAIIAALATVAALAACGPSDPGTSGGVSGFPCSTIQDCRAPATCRGYTCDTTAHACIFRDLADGAPLTCPSPECHADADCAGLADFAVHCDTGSRTCLAGGAAESGSGGAGSTSSSVGGASGSVGAGSGTSVCVTCACELLQSQGGCADVCAMGINGTMTPNFCDGVTAGAPCDSCVRTRCGVAPADCH